ncbi:MAG: phosphatase PAP2 family protein [Lysobacterales bacterium]|jgi:membrane-associated phospholipid phosphatase
MAVLFCIGLSAQTPVLAEEQVEKNGDTLQWAILGAGLGSAVFYEEGSEGAWQFFKSFAVSQVVTEGLKRVTDKTRPDGNCCKSFPSGHTSKSFMGATFIHKRYGWKYAVPAYIAATYVGYSRVEADKHYWEDVVAGAAIGIVSSWFLTTPYDDVEITPLVGNGMYGVHISKRW